MIVMASKFSIKSSKSSTKSKNPLVVLLFLISFSIYTLYCIYHQGSFVRGLVGGPEQIIHYLII